MNLAILFANCAWNIQYQTVGNDVNYAFVEDGEHLYIYFQGSNSVTDWIRNFLFGKRPYKDMEIPYRVHRGFLAAWKEVEDIVIEKITEKVKREATQQEKMNGVLEGSEYKWKHITVVGYSHGGALAAFCHECVWYWRPDLRENGFEGFGFEAPKIYAGYKVKKELRERWNRFTVIRDNRDIVTFCPPWIFGYSHVGEMLKIHGDRSLVTKKWIPCCVKDHYPQTVYDGLKKLC